MNLLKIILVGCLVIAIAGCTSRSAQVPVEGDMDGRSKFFCKERDYGVDGGFVCSEIEVINFTIATNGRYSNTDLEAKIIKVFNDEIVDIVKPIYKSYGRNINFWPMGTFDVFEWLSSPPKNRLTIEIHLLDGFFEKKESQAICQKYWIFMIGPEWYLRTPREYCVKNNFDEEIAAKSIIADLVSILDGDLFKYPVTNNK